MLHEKIGENFKIKAEGIVLKDIKHGEVINLKFIDKGVRL